MTQMIGLFLRGLAMGFADVIPGVSGGTLALILGIYVRFIDAIKSVNFRWIAPMLRWAVTGFKREGRDEALRDLLSIHWSFLIPLGAGIVGSFGVGSVVVPFLMDRFPAPTAAFFTGLILASIAVPIREMPKRGPQHVVIGIVALISILWGPSSPSRRRT